MYVLGYIYYLHDRLAGGRPAARLTREPGPLDRLERLARGLLAAYRRSRARQRVERDLGGLPDWALKDIGVARGEIPGVAEAMSHEADTGTVAARRERVRPQTAGQRLAAPV